MLLILCSLTTFVFLPNTKHNQKKSGTTSILPISYISFVLKKHKSILNSSKIPIHISIRNEDFPTPPNLTKHPKFKGQNWINST